MKLLNCPHCNGPAYLQQNYSWKWKCYFVFAKCDLCGAQGKICKSDEDAVEEDWNTEACQQAAMAWNMRNGKLERAEIPYHEPEEEYAQE